MVALLFFGWFLYLSVADQIEEKLNFEAGSFAYKRSGAKFEEEARTSLRSFSLFYLFGSNKIPLNTWITENNVVRDKKDLIFTQDATLEGLIRNSCDEDRCFQLRRKFSQIPNVVKQVLIGVEDLRFLSHQGVDLKSILRAIIVDVANMRLAQGASTITQQVVKNLVLTQEKTIVRKIKEIFIAVYLERYLSKEEILTLYFNEIYWGAIGGVKTKGIAAAAMLYFQKSLEEVSEYESAILIGLLKGPYYYHPIFKTQRLKDRANLLYRKLVELGGVSKISKKWDDKQWDKWVADLKKSQSSKDFLILSRLASLDDKKSQINDYEKYIIQKEVSKVLEGLKEGSFTSKVAIKDITCKTNCGEPYFFYSSFERDTEVAFKDEIHPIGSTVKPIIYSYLFKNGINNEQLFSTEKLRMKLKTSVWRPRESSRNVPKEVSPEFALRRSLNRPLLRMVDLVGYEGVQTYLQSYFADLKIPLNEYPAQLLGAIDVSLEKLLLAYEKLIKQECSGSAFEKESEDLIADGEVRQRSAIQVLSDHKDSTLKRATHRLIKGLRFFGKTGTTNSGFDTWFIGFDGQYLAIIWVGWEGNRKEDLKFKNFGSSTAFPIYQNWLLERGKRLQELYCKN